MQSTHFKINIMIQNTFDVSKCSGENKRLIGFFIVCNLARCLLVHPLYIVLKPTHFIGRAYPRTSIINCFVSLRVLNFIRHSSCAGGSDCTFKTESFKRQ